MYPQDFLPIAIPVPPMLPDALEFPLELFPHTGEAPPRFVAFYWSCREIAYTDGCVSGVGLLNTDAFFAFVTHAAIRPNLPPLHQLGTSVTPATHWLVLDCQKPYQLYLAPVEEARTFLAQQWGLPKQQEVSGIEENTLFDDELSSQSWTHVTSSVRQMTEALRALEKRRQRTEELVAWLDTYALKQV